MVRFAQKKADTALEGLSYPLLMEGFSSPSEVRANQKWRRFATRAPESWPHVIIVSIFRASSYAPSTVYKASRHHGPLSVDRFMLFSFATIHAQAVKRE